jgi:hypothetical protein
MLLSERITFLQEGIVTRGVSRLSLRRRWRKHFLRDVGRPSNIALWSKIAKKYVGIVRVLMESRGKHLKSDFFDCFFVFFM